MKSLIPYDEYGVFVDNKRIDELVHQAILNSSKNLDTALQLVDEAFSELNCPWIEHCVRETIMTWFSNSRPNEQTVYKWFTKNYKEKLGKVYEIKKRKNNSKHIPDFWLSVDGEDVPVECKLGEFDDKALKQLQRYMDYYVCKRGVAVAQKLSTELPSNITFIEFSLDELDDI